MVGRVTVLVAGTFLAVLGLLVVVGWVVRIPTLIRIDPSWVPMHFNTALGMILIGIAFIAAWSEWRRTAVAASALLATLALATLAEYLFELDLGIDQAFIEAWTTTATPFPGRMSVNSAVLFSICGIALTVGAWRRFTGRAAEFVRLAGLVVVAGGAAVATGYLLGFDHLGGWTGFSYVALHTALAFVAAGIGMVNLGGPAPVDRLGSRANLFGSLVFLVLAVASFNLWQALAEDQVERLQASSRMIAAGLKTRVESRRRDYVSALTRMAERLGRHDAELHLDQWTADARAYLDAFAGLRTIGLVLSDGIIARSASRFVAEIDGRPFVISETRAELLESAYASMVFTASGPLDLRLGGRGALLLVPFIRGDEKSVIVASVVYRDLFAEMLEGLAPGYAVRVQVGDEPAFERSVDGAHDLDPSLTHRVVVDATGPDWVIEIAPGGAVVTDARDALPMAVLALGLTAAFLVGISIRLAGRARAHARKVDETAHRLQAERTITDAVWRGSNDVICTVDRKGRFRRLSDACERLWGYTPEELEGRVVHDMIVEEERGRSLAEHERVGQGFPTTGFTARMNHCDGSVVHVSWSANWSDELGLYVAIARDITERVAREHELEVNSERLRVAVGQTGRVVYDRDLVRGAYDWVGDPRQLVGHSVAELAAMSVEDWYARVHPDDVPNVRTVFESVQAAGGAYSVTYRWRLPDDRYVWIEDAGGMTGNHMIGVLTDVSERRQFEFELERRVDLRTRELALANRELEAFSYSASHDLRAPLRAISGFAELLAEEYGSSLGEEGRHYLRRILDGTERMSLLIDDLLTLGRVSRHEIVRQSVDLSAIAARVVKRLREADLGREVDVRIAPGLQVDADPRLVEVVMENLLGNAWKFTGHREDARIEVASDDGWTVVRDNGVGFDMAYSEHLYGVFQRLHGAEEFPGTGVGLATVKRVIDRHGGTIRAESSVGNGASFLFRFT